MSDAREIHLQQLRRMEARQRECPYRRESGCGAVDMLLAWKHHRVTMDECDACWKACSGRPDSQKGREYRRAMAETVVVNVYAHLEHERHDVIEAVLRTHVSPQDRLTTLRRVARKLGPDRSRKLAEWIDGLAEESEASRAVEAVFAGLSAEEIQAGMNPKRSRKAKVVLWPSVRLWGRLWGIPWEGTPWPKRPFIALLSAWRAFWGTWARLRKGGCGCQVQLKAASRSILSWLLRRRGVA